MDYFDLLNREYDIPEAIPYTPQEMYDAMHLGEAPAKVRNKILDDIAFQDQISRLKRLTDNFSKDQEFTVRSEAYLNPNAKEITWDITEGNPGDGISASVPSMKVPNAPGFTAPVNRVTHNHPTNLLGYKINKLAPPSAIDYGSAAAESIVSTKYPNMAAPKWTVMGRDGDGNFNGYDFGVSKTWDGPLYKRIPRAIDIVKDNVTSAALDAGLFKPGVDETTVNDIIEQRRAILDKSKGLITHPLGQGFEEKPFSVMEEALLPLAPAVAAIGSGLAYNKVRKKAVKAVGDTVEVAKKLPIPLIGGAVGITGGIAAGAMINNKNKEKKKNFNAFIDYFKRPPPPFSLTDPITDDVVLWEDRSKEVSAPNWLIPGEQDIQPNRTVKSRNTAKVLGKPFLHKDKKSITRQPYVRLRKGYQTNEIIDRLLLDKAIAENMRQMVPEYVQRKFGMEAPCATANFFFDPSMLWDMGQHAVGAIQSGIGSHMTPIIGAMGAMGAANARGAAAAKVAKEGAAIGEAIADQKVKAERYKNLAIGGTLAAGGGGLLLGGKLQNDKYRTRL